MNVIITILLVFIAIILWWWFVKRNEAKYPPLNIDENDPLMINAIKKAKETLNQFEKLYQGSYVVEAQVKIPFITNSGMTEHLWAEVIDKNQNILKVRYLTPPVSHQGLVERIHEYKLDELEDWVIIIKSGKIYGGYTQRVMFQRGRELWGSLPPELKKQESRYVT